jgi:hypothetical protein
MPIYNVHIYREMRLAFSGVEAESHEAAATIARDRPTDLADAIEDCEGETTGALVDVQGDEEYSLSKLIDFESERTRKAAGRLLAACRMVVQRWECGDLAEAARACSAAVTEAEAAGSPPAPPDINIHAMLAAQRQIAAIWSIEDVQQVRPHLTDQQAWEVLRQVDRRHNAEIGINWDVLAWTADEVAADEA